MNKAEDWVLRISQASSVGLIIINYELILESIEACKQYASNDKQRNNSRDKAISFLQEIIHALDMSYEISHGLFDLYIYVQKRVIEGVNHKKPNLLDEAIYIIKSLKDAFEAIAHVEDDKEPVIKNAQQVYAGLTYGKTGVNESVLSGKNGGFKI